MIVCKLCGFETPTIRTLAVHLSWSHKTEITKKEYYDKYLRTEGEGICPVCHKETPFLSLSAGYQWHCNSKCSNNDPVVLQHCEDAIEKKFGVRRAMQSEELKEKFRQSFIEKHGCDNPTKDPDIIKKVNRTAIEKYGGIGMASAELKKRADKTCLERNGYACGWNKQNYQKSILTWMEHFGKDNPAKEASTRQKMLTTRIKNGKDSRSEKLFAARLKELGIKYIREFTSEKYPFFCDFYLPDFDLYIELNIHWTHGGHYFDSNNPADVAKVEEWEQKAEDGSYFYKCAVKTWSVSDLEKKKVAKKNRLNYIVLWNQKDVEDFLYG